MLSRYPIFEIYTLFVTLVDACIMIEKDGFIRKINKKDYNTTLEETNLILTLVIYKLIYNIRLL